KPLDTQQNITDFINRRESKLQNRFKKLPGGQFYLKGKDYNTIFMGTDKHSFQGAFGSTSHMQKSGRIDENGKPMVYSHQPLKSINVLNKPNGETTVYKTVPVFGLLGLKNGNGKPTHLGGVYTSRQPGSELRGRGTKLLTFNQKPVNPSSSGSRNNILGTSKKQNIHPPNTVFVPPKKTGTKPQAKTFNKFPATSHQSIGGLKPTPKPSPGSSTKTSPWG
ncbi:unnamed protein product, partial [Allacma fusca]